jgi:hypothetical protein
MRIDGVRQATQSPMTTAANIETVAIQFRKAIYTFGSDRSSQRLTISSLTPRLLS